MLVGKGQMIVEKAEILQALNYYFGHCVVDDSSINGQQYATVIDINQIGENNFELEIEGLTVEEK